MLLHSGGAPKLGKNSLCRLRGAGRNSDRQAATERPEYRLMGLRVRLNLLISVMFVTILVL
ncbi:MAG TPA: hypothetical protein VIQ99_01805, partial [Gammaproteobacteria bacterium]